MDRWCHQDQRLQLYNYSVDGYLEVCPKCWSKQYLSGSATGIRTPVNGLKTRCPNP